MHKLSLHKKGLFRARLHLQCPKLIMSRPGSELQLTSVLVACQLRSGTVFRLIGVARDVSEDWHKFLGESLSGEKYVAACKNIEKW